MDQLPKKTVSVVIINWNTTPIVAASVQALFDDPHCLEVLVIDNGSKDAQYLLFYNDKGREMIKCVLLSENYGSSHARNIGINLAKGEYIFLLDGDIRYVPGTLAAYLQAFLSIPDLGCIGQNNVRRLKIHGFNGTRQLIEADEYCLPIKVAEEGFPMAWTQYGLFKGSLLRKLNFPTQGPFGEPGHGYEDDWLYQVIKSNTAFRVVHTPIPLYYHDAHSSLNQLKDASNTLARKALYLERFGGTSHWTEHVRNDLSGSYTVHQIG